MKEFKKKFLQFIFLTLFFFGTVATTNAQNPQNLIISCLNPTILDPPNQTINGKSYHHLISLKNPDFGIFEPGKPVYIIRSLTQVFCNPNDNDPECKKDSQGRISPCIVDKIGKNICKENCPWGNHVCKPDEPGAVCCMPLYTKQGPYYECANDKDGNPVCPDSIMAQPGQANGIRPSENGHIETGYGSNFLLIYDDSSTLVADENGNINIAAVQDYTRASLDHGYYGIQILSNDAINNDAVPLQRSLKLALFTQTEMPSAINCITVFWDPYGKVIDSTKLEPIPDLPILLKNLDPLSGKIVNTTVANNPAFKNPDPTDLAGNFNFAVPGGTYFLEPITSKFTFPIKTEVLNQVLSALQSFDPNQEYIERDKIYNNLTEPIVEKEGFPEKRNIVLQPKDPLYQGSTPAIMSAENFRHEGDQLIRGRASHPKSIIKVYLNGAVVGQTEADMQGKFTLIIPQSAIGDNPGDFAIYAEKVPLVQTTTINKQPSFNRRINQVLALQNTVSQPYYLPLVPVRITGFVFDGALKTQPNSIVKLSIPSLGGLNYSQTISDENGYIDIDSNDLPPFDFVLSVNSPDKEESYQLTIDDFNKTNVVFLEETKQSLYNTKVTSSKPDASTVDKIIGQTTKRVSPKTLSLNQPKPDYTQAKTEVKEQSTSNNNQIFMLIFITMLLLTAGVGFVIIQHNKNKKQIYP